MPGQFYEVPGAALGDGYVIPGVTNGGAMAAALADTRAVLDEQAEREAALPPDPGIVNARNAIYNEHTAAKDSWAARKQAHYKDPTRQRYTKEGLTALDQEFETKLAGERDALRDRLARRLDVVEEAV